MRMLREIAARARGLFGKDRLDRDLDEELQSHLEMLADENIRRGMSVDEAISAARRSFGGVIQTTEAYRDQRGLPMLETVLQDLRYGVRILRKNPGFTTVAVLTLALGIGANSAMFSVLDAVMIQTLPVRSADQLVMLKWSAKGFPSVIQDLEGNSLKGPNGEGIIGEAFSYPTYESVRARNTAFSDVVAFCSNLDHVNAQFNGKADSAVSQPVSGNYFAGLGVDAYLGRMIVPEDDSPAADPVTIISYAYWKRMLGGDTSVIGSTIVVNNVPLTIIGVAPREFYGTQPGNSVDMWLPLHVYPRLVQSLNFNDPAQYGGDAIAAATAYWEKPTTWWLVVMGRLKPGVSEESARSELRVIFDQTVEAAAAAEPSAEKNDDRPVLTTTAGSQGMDELRRHFSQPLFVLMAAVGLVLLIACANVGGLLLARATARQKEIVVRLSLGARRLRLIQQLLTESLLLALAGGALGLLIARWVSELLVALVASGREEITLPLELNGRVLAFTAFAAIFTGVLFGLAPAFSATRVSLTAALKVAGAGSRALARRSKVAQALVSAQIALSLVLLVGAGLFLRTLQRLESVPLGFDREHLLLFSIAPGLNGYQGARLADYYRNVQDRIGAVPGVNAVSFSLHGPVGDGTSTTNAAIPGVTSGKDRFTFHRHLVGPAYFKTLGIPLLVGRVLDERDNANAPKVAVVNQAFARQAFGDENPLGRTLNFGSDAKPRGFEIVGVVGDAKYNDLRKPAPPTGYFSHLQSINGASFMTFQVRTSSDPNAIVETLRKQVAEIDRNIPVARIDTLAGRIDKALLFERMFSRLTGSFGLLALVLVCVGLYGTMSYFVARRTNEIGIRMALGAQPVRVFRMVLVEGLTLTGAGIVAGLAAAALGTKLISSTLFEVPALDPLTFVSVIVLLVVVGVFACYIPARRAMKVDPMVALRYE